MAASPGVSSSNRHGSREPSCGDASPCAEHLLAARTLNGVPMPRFESIHLAKHETYLANANDCQRKAETSPNEIQKHTWEQMAVSWALLAKARASLAANQSSDASGKAEEGGRDSPLGRTRAL